MKRKVFNCHVCSKETSKTAPNYYAQIKRLGYALCTDCAIEKNSSDTSDRLKNKYKNLIKNKDIIEYKCEICGKNRKVQHRTKRDGYTKCKSCAAKENHFRNSELYNALAEKRSNNNLFADKVRDGMISIPEGLRVERSLNAHKMRWSNNIDDRCKIFIEKSAELHSNKYDYSKVEYVNFSTPVIIICKEHGEFEQTPRTHCMSGYGCKRCSELRIMSSGHEEIAEYVSSFGVDVENNNRSIISPYEVDIWVPKYSIAIEYHGVYWHSYNSRENQKQKTFHKSKSDIAQLNNILLIQIFETEWIQKREIVKSIIASKFNHTNTIHARKCTIETPSDNEYAEFMNRYHLQGYRPSSYKIGLYYNGSLQTAIGISKHSTESYELIRLATRFNTTITGGLSKLLARAKFDLRLNRLMTYADRRFSNGNGYLKCGFVHMYNTDPNYYYTTGSKNAKLSNRQSYQKHKQSAKLQYFNQELSESENMFNNGWRRIWDAGHMKLVKTWPTDIRES